MLTVLIPTRNGAGTLPAVLEAVLRIAAPPGGWKLVVVVNGSTDRTQEIVSSFSDRLPLTSVLEKTSGKNAALNAGLPFVEGDLVVFSDDDSFPRRDWLVRLRAAADRHPAFGMFGGVIRPRWQSRPPNWLSNGGPMAAAYTATDPALVEGLVEAGHLFGPNLAIRTEFFDRGYRFDISRSAHQAPVGLRWAARPSSYSGCRRMA